MTLEWTTELGMTSKHPRVVEQFDDTNADDEHMLITGMKIWISRWSESSVCSGLKVSYKNGSSVLHGSERGYQTHEFQLDDGDFICAMDARSGCLVDQLTFKTSKDWVLGPYGGNGGDVKDVNPSAYKPGAPKRGALATVKGSVVQTYEGYQAVCGIGFCWRLFDE